MATAQRIYKVTHQGGAHLVQAISQAQALRHVAGNLFAVEVAKPIDVAQLMSAGAKLEIATTIAEQPALFGEEIAE